MPKTSIEWCDFSWPVLNGCRRCSDGCRNCYAERLCATRLRHTKRYRGLAVFQNGPRWTGESRLDSEELEKPLRMRKPRRIFVAEMGDLFYEGNSNEQIAAVFGVMAACPQHTFQVLTKRPERMVEWFAAKFGLENAEQTVAREAEWHGGIIWDSRGSDRFRYPSTAGDVSNRRPWPGWPLPNLWLGVSIENQAAANERIPLLLQTPSAVRWVSCEPLLGPIRFDDGVLGSKGHLAESFGNPLINWVVVGGESGPGARPMDENWVRSIRDQCVADGVPMFFKQRLENGRKVSLPLLDGVQWAMFPEAAEIANGEVCR